jgi:hypothetical protein
MGGAFFSNTNETGLVTYWKKYSYSPNFTERLSFTVVGYSTGTASLMKEIDIKNIDTD